MKRLMMIAGPNGAGKTTTTKAFLTQHIDLYSEFLNADEIARGLSPLHPENVNREAGELMIKRFHACVKSDINFAFETTAAGISYANHLKKAKQRGYEINLMYLWLSNPDQAIKRVALRVKQGGHNIPVEDIIRRYYRGLKNILNLYLTIADTALILDSSSIEYGIKKIMAKKQLGLELQIEDKELWENLREFADVKV